MTPNPDNMETAPRNDLEGGGALLRRIGLSLLLLAVILTGTSGLLERAVAASPLAQADSHAQAYLDESQKKAVQAFTAARLLNGGITFLRNVEFKPVGVGVSPFQVLDPVDDLAESFSNVMLVSSVAIFAQTLLLKLGTIVGLGIALPAGCACLLAAVWMPAGLVGAELRLRRLGEQIIVLALFARLLIPVTGWAGSELSQSFLAAERDAAVRSMEFVGNALNDKTQEQADRRPEIPDGVFDGLFDGAKEILRSMTADLGDLTDEVAALPDTIILALKIFVVETILVPLTVTGLLYLLLRQMVLGTGHAVDLQRLSRWLPAYERRAMRPALRS